MSEQVPSVSQQASFCNVMGIKIKKNNTLAENIIARQEPRTVLDQCKVTSSYPQEIFELCIPLLLCFDSKLTGVFQ